MKIQFDIKYKPQIESGEYKVETRDGRPVRIICWDAKGLCPIIYLLNPTGFGGDSTENPCHCNNEGYYCNRSGCQNEDLFIITSEPELTEFEQELINFFNERNAILPDKDGVYNRHDCDELLHKTANKLLELAKKEICKRCTVGLDQYWKGREDARKEYEKPITFYYPTYQPLCFNGGICTNPLHDCINCPRQNSGTTINTSGTCKKD